MKPDVRLRDLPLERTSRDLLDAAPDAIVVADQDGRVVFANGEAERVFDCPREVLNKLSIEDLLPERYRQRHVEYRAMFAGAPRLRPMGAGRDLVARRRDGSEFPVEISLSPLHTTEGMLVMASVRDVSDRRQLEREKDELLAVNERARAEAERAREEIGRLSSITEFAAVHRSLDEMLPELLSQVHGILAADVTTVLLLGADEMLRVRATIGQDETLARTAVIPLGRGFAGRVAAERRPLCVEDTATTEILNPAVVAAGIRSMLGVPLLVQGELLGVLSIGTVLPRRFGDDDVRLLQLVADRVGLAIKRLALYEAEQRARAAAEGSLLLRAETERLKDDLTNMVVHDLKNPLNGITMLVQLSLRKSEDLPANHVERLRQIQMTCGEMMRLIQNLLEISKIEEGKMPIVSEQVSLREIADDVVREYAAVAEQMSRRLHLLEDDSAQRLALGDPGLLRRVVINLVVNALRHSGSQDVWVDVGATTQEACVRVIDRGRGIAASDQARVFEKFAVVRRSLGDPSGDTGLGLPFCRLAVEGMGGRIELRSDDSETIFSVSLPLAG